MGGEVVAIKSLPPTQPCPNCSKDTATLLLLQCLHPLCSECVGLLSKDAPEGITCPECKSVTPINGRDSTPVHHLATPPRQKCHSCLSTDNSVGAKGVDMVAVNGKPSHKAGSRSGPKVVLYCGDCSQYMCATHMEQHLTNKKTKHHKSEVVVHCGECAQQAAASSICMECRKFLCALHEEAHKKSASSGSHTIQPLASIDECPTVEIQAFTCNQHLKKTKLFCHPCRSLICSSCLTDESAHKDHKPFQETGVAIQTERKRLEEQLNSLHSEIQVLERLSRSISNSKEDIETSFTACCEDITTSIEDLCTALLDREKELLETAQRMKETRLMNVERETTMVRWLLSNSRYCANFIENLMIDCSTMEILDVSRSVESRVEKILSRSRKWQTTVDNKKLSEEPLKFLPSENGKHAARTFGTFNKTYASSPKHCSIQLPSKTSVSTASDRPAVQIRVEESWKFLVIANGVSGKRIQTGGEEFRASASLQDSAGGKGNFQIEVKDLNDGSYEIHCMPLQTGLYSLDVTLQNISIKGSPFHAVVSGLPPLPEAVQAQGFTEKLATAAPNQGSALSSAKQQKGAELVVDVGSCGLSSGDVVAFAEHLQKSPELRAVLLDNTKIAGLKRHARLPLLFSSLEQAHGSSIGEIATTVDEGPPAPNSHNDFTKQETNVEETDQDAQQTHEPADIDIDVMDVPKVVEPPPNRSYIVQQFLNIVVESAKNLPASDVFGKGNFYVTASLGKETASTKVISGSLNPTWKEEINFFVPGGWKGLQVKFEVWDRDKTSRNDMIFSRSFDVNDSLVNGKLQQLPLNDKASSHLMIIADANPKRRGLLVCTLKSAHDLKKMDTFGKSDPYVELSVESAKKTSTTKPKTCDPVWEESFTFSVTDLDKSVLRFDVFDHDKISKNDKMGGTSLSLKSAPLDDKKPLDYSRDLGTGNGTIKFDLRFEPSTEKGGNAVTSLNAIVHEAQVAEKGGLFGKKRSYLVEITAGGDIQKTSSVKGDALKWEEKLSFVNCFAKELSIAIVDSKGGRIGPISIPTNNLNSQLAERWYNLDGKKNRIRVSLSVTSDESKSDVAPSSSPVEISETKEASSVPLVERKDHSSHSTQQINPSSDATQWEEPLSGGGKEDKQAPEKSADQNTSVAPAQPSIPTNETTVAEEKQPALSQSSYLAHESDAREGLNDSTAARGGKGTAGSGPPSGDKKESTHLSNQSSVTVEPTHSPVSQGQPSVPAAHDSGSERQQPKEHVSEETTPQTAPNEVGFRALVSIRQAFVCNSQLTFLSLNYNKIGASGASVISEMIRESTSLTVLQVSSCKLTDTGVAAIAASLPNSTSLTSLDVSANDVTPLGALELSKGIHRNTSLHSLDVSNNYCMSGIVDLARVLASKSTLRYLNMAENRLTWAMMDEFFRILGHNETLTALSIAGNPLPSLDGLDRLHQHGTLVWLDISNIGDVGETALFWICDKLLRRTSPGGSTLVELIVADGANGWALTEGFVPSTLVVGVEHTGSVLSAVEGSRAHLSDEERNKGGRVLEALTETVCGESRPVFVGSRPEASAHSTSLKEVGGGGGVDGVE